MATKCERCGTMTDPNSYELLDYCAVCSKNLCDKCMEEGCCGNKPAKSGTEEESPLDQAATRKQWERAKAKKENS